MTDEWGPWIEHDGKGCPCVGAYVQCETESPGGFIHSDEGIAGERGGFSWDWSYFGKVPPGQKSGAAMRILRYRIRKSRGMTILEGLIADLPKEVDA